MLLLTALLAVAAPLPEPKPANEFYGDAVVAILEGATRVEILRLDPQLVDRTPGETNIEGYVVSASIEGGKNQAQAVGKVVLADPQKPLRSKVIFFDPTIGFRLWKDKENVVILLDPASGSLMQVFGHNADGKIIKQTLTTARAPTMNALLKQAKEAFPNDAGLRQIKEIEEK